MSQLQNLIQALDDAEAEVRAEMLRLYPKGSRVAFKIMHGQVNDSTGVVCGTDVDPRYLRVEHDQAKQRSRYKYRSVFHKQLTSI